MAFDFSELSLNLQRAHGRRIALRPASLSDAWPLFHATRNPLFNKHLLWPQPQQEAAVLERMEARVAGWPLFRSMGDHFLIVLRRR